MDWKNSTVLVTGGTGSFGRRFVQLLLAEHSPRKVIVFSRDELKQHEMQQDGFVAPNIRFFLGDIRDPQRLHRALSGVDIVVHAAALKQVPACEYNPIEAINTNVMGARNVIDAAIDVGVKRVLALSTDKAVNPINLYGATKLCMEKLVVQANAYSSEDRTRFACVRYGNVVGSRGSVIPVFEAQRQNGTITVTDPRMTRFWITLEQGVRFVMHCIERMHGGEVFVPKIPSMNIMDLAHAVAPDAGVESIGIRPGEKLHELLIAEDEARHTIELDDCFVVQPQHPWWQQPEFPGAKQLPAGFSYASDSNPEKLTVAELREMIGQTPA
ncbi:MAG: UDP-N-acetylglucosamine 4,6-dehydratase (inverting) [Planctomycetota bacterium]